MKQVQREEGFRPIKIWTDDIESEALQQATLTLREIAGFEGRYAVSECGGVWSYSSNKWLKQRVANRGKGYLYVGLWSDNKEKKEYVHRLVASAFIERIDGKVTVNHKDGNTRHNHRENLEWLSHQEQQDHAWETGLTDNAGEKCGTVKLTEKQMLEIREISGKTQREIGLMFGISQSEVSRIKSKKRWGFKNVD